MIEPRAQNASPSECRTPDVESVSDNLPHEDQDELRAASPTAAYLQYCFLVSVLVVGLKLLIAPYIPNSAVLADDYDSLNRAIYYVQGHLSAAAGGYPYKEVAAGLLYFVLITPWVYFPPETRLIFVFGMNSLLSAFAVFFASITVARLSRKESLLVPLAFAAFGPLFIFSFYVMTENLFFALLAMVAWLVVDFPATCNSKRRLVMLFLLTAALPLTRPPGLAIVPGLLWLLWRNRDSLSRIGYASLSLLLPVTAILPYNLYSSLVAGRREGRYMKSILATLEDPDRWLFTAQLFLSQFAYLFVSGGFWILPVALMLLSKRNHSCGTVPKQWRNFLEFTFLTGFLFISLCVMHLLFKLLDMGRYTDPSPWFIYGRYDDPALMLLAIAGIGGIFVLEVRGVVSKTFFRILVPLLLALALFSFIGYRHWVPINFASLSVFAGYNNQNFPQVFLALWVFLAAVLCWLPGQVTWRPQAFVIFFLVFSVFTSWNGMAYTKQRAERIENGLMAAEWVNNNVSPNECIAYDATVASDAAPMAIKRVGNIYRAMMFRTYPRGFALVRSLEEAAPCKYIYGTSSSSLTRSLSMAWKNDGYAVYFLPSIETTSNVPTEHEAISNDAWLYLRKCNCKYGSETTARSRKISYVKLSVSTVFVP